VAETIYPANDVHVFNILRKAYREGKRVAIYGTGKHSNYRESEVQIYMKEMNYFKISGGSVEAQAGAIVEEIRKEASSSDLILPFLYSGTLGGMIALNEPSTLSTAYGPPFDNVEYVEGVTPFFKTRFKFLVGSKGKLAAITSAKLKLYPKPSRVYTADRVIKKAEVLREVKRLMELKPISLILTFDGMLTVHSTYTFDPKLTDYSIEEGVTIIEENDAEPLTVISKEPLEVFLDVVYKLYPTYAYTICGTPYSRFYKVNPAELKSLVGDKGLVLEREQPSPFHVKLSWVLNFRKTLV
jgi:hypothetical protein